MKKNVKSIFLYFIESIKTKSWHASITMKIAALAWSLIISSIIIIGVYNFITQEAIIINRMEIESSNISESIIQAHATSLFTDNYEVVIDFCTKLIGSSSSIEFIVLTKKDGNSLIFKKNSWSFEELKGTWINPEEFYKGKKSYSTLLNKECYRYSRPFVFTGIIWGNIHLGISLDSYNEALRNLITRTAVFSFSFVLIGFVVSVIFSRRLTRPIKELVQASHSIEQGDLKARAQILSKDELGFLAKSFNSMANAIASSNERLEATVEKRTAELEHTNKQLTEEVEERKRAEQILKQYTTILETLEEIYAGIINSKTIEDVFYSTIKSTHSNLINFRVAALALYDSKKSLMRVDTYFYENNKLIKQFNEYPLNDNSVFNNFSNKDYHLQNDLNMITQKSFMENVISSEGIVSYISFPLSTKSDIEGELYFCFDENLIPEDEKINTLVEISRHLSVAVMQLYLEEKLILHTKELSRSLEEKEILLKEIHHRVKNNLQVISSLLYLQSRNIQDEAIKTIFGESQMRVRSLALVHEKLYQSSDFSRIDFSDYIKNLLSHIRSSYKTTSEFIEIILELDKVYLSVDKAVPLGLILNELLSNAFKYAFPENSKDNSDRKFIMIKLDTIDENKLLLTVSDNGIGVPDDFDINKSNSLGLKIVSSLVTQIDGDLKIKHKNDTEFSLIFSIN
jgi:two-component sensor histidine kinase/HAMP domain-containing protein